MINERKHVNIAIEGWTQAFATDPNARLLIKARWQISTLTRTDPRITLIDENRPTRGIADLYERADVLLSVGNEGFSLPLIEGMATGLPCIALDSEGQHDVVEDAPDCVMPIPPHHWQPSDDTDYGSAGRRAVPGAEDIAESLRWVAANRGEACALGARAASWALTERNIWRKGPEVLRIIAGSQISGGTTTPQGFRELLTAQPRVAGCGTY